jgi:hypothetical protein
MQYNSALLTLEFAGLVVDRELEGLLGEEWLWSRFMLLYQLVLMGPIKKVKLSLYRAMEAHRVVKR